MAAETPFDQLTWGTLLYLWGATEPIDVADSLCREYRDLVRKELSATLNRKAVALDGGGSRFHRNMLKQFRVPTQSVASSDVCDTCGVAVMTAPVSDGSGGTIYAYQCTAELVVKADKRVQQIKRCPDINRVGREQPILSDASVQKERGR